MGTDIHLYIEYKDENGKWQLDKAERDNYGISRKNPFFGWSVPEKHEGIPSDVSDSYKKNLSYLFEPYRYYSYTLKELKEIEWSLDMKDLYNDPEYKHSKEYKEFIIKLEEFSMQNGGDDNVRILYCYTL